MLLIGLHYSSTGGGDPTTAIVIAVLSVIIHVAVVTAIILVAVHCQKIGVQGVYDMRSSEHVCEVYVKCTYTYCVLCLYCESTRWL